MGCLDSVPDESPEGRARKYEDTLHLGSLSSDNFKSSFFSLYKDGEIVADNYNKGWDSF